jgi:hypothetical protein
MVLVDYDFFGSLAKVAILAASEWDWTFVQF